MVLAAAVENYNLKAVRDAIRSGADCNSRCVVGAISTAVLGSSHSADLVRLLLLDGGMKAPDNLLSIAIRFRRYDVAGLLVANGAKAAQSDIDALKARVEMELPAKRDRELMRVDAEIGNVHTLLGALRERQAAADIRTDGRERTGIR